MHGNDTEKATDCNYHEAAKDARMKKRVKEGTIQLNGSTKVRKTKSRDLAEHKSEAAWTHAPEESVKKRLKQKRSKLEAEQSTAAQSKKKLRVAKTGKLSNKMLAAKEGKSSKPKKIRYDCEGRQFDLTHVVVNFANVGHSYGKHVENRQFDMFDWEGIRRCVRFLTKKKMKVTGVIHQNYTAPDNGLQRVTLPADIKAMCESIQETPRIAGFNHQSADDEMTIKCAYRRVCRFLDNDNYAEWKSQLRDKKIRQWLEKHKMLLHMHYYFDSGTGSFDLLDGNHPESCLEVNQEMDKKALARMGRH